MEQEGPASSHSSSSSFFLLQYSFLMALKEEEKTDGRVKIIQACMVICLTTVALTNILRIIIIPLMGSEYWFEPKDKKKGKTV